MWLNKASTLSNTVLERENFLNNTVDDYRVYIQKISIRIDLDPEPGARKLTKINTLTWFPAFQNNFCTHVGMIFDILRTGT